MVGKAEGDPALTGRPAQQPFSRQPTRVKIIPTSSVNVAASQKLAKRSPNAARTTGESNGGRRACRRTASSRLLTVARFFSAGAGRSLSDQPRTRVERATIATSARLKTRPPADVDELEYRAAR